MLGYSDGDCNSLMAVPGACATPLTRTHFSSTHASCPILAALDEGVTEQVVDSHVLTARVAVSSAQADTAPTVAPAADAAGPVGKPVAATDNTNPVTEAKFEPTEDAMKSEAAAEAAAPVASTNGKLNAEEAKAPKDADAAVADSGEDSAPAAETPGDAPNGAKAPEAAKDKEDKPSTAEATSAAAQPVEASAVPAATNGAASSDKDSKVGDKRPAETVQAEANSSADAAAATNNGPVSKAKAAVKKAAEPLAKKLKTDKRDKGDADVAMANAAPPANETTKPVENGTNGLKRTKSTKRDKKLAAPVGRTERKTRSQGPI